MQPWFGFYAVTGGASATLLGLLFVSVSMNLAATLGPAHEGSKRLAEQAFQNYLAVLLISLLVFFPQIKLSTFGLVTLCVTAVWTFWVLARFYLAIAKPIDHEPRFHALRRHFSSVVGFGILSITALRMALNQGDDRSWFASAIIVLLFSATMVSWELLVRIARTAQADRPS